MLVKSLAKSKRVCTKNGFRAVYLNWLCDQIYKLKTRLFPFLLFSTAVLNRFYYKSNRKNNLQVTQVEAPFSSHKH